MEFTCCDHTMQKIVAVRIDGVNTVLHWCAQCGRAIKRVGLNEMFMDTVYTPVDNYKGCNRECL